MVPSFCSSASSRIVNAGASGISKKVAPWKKLLKEASGKGFPRSRTKKNPLSAMKISATMYATGLLK